MVPNTWLPHFLLITGTTGQDLGISVYDIMAIRDFFFPTQKLTKKL